MLNVIMLSVVMLNGNMLSVIMVSVIMVSVIMVSVIVLSVIMLSVIMLSAIMLSVIMLSAIMLSVIMLSAIMQSIVMLNFVMLSVLAPYRLNPICQSSEEVVFYADRDGTDTVNFTNILQAAFSYEIFWRSFYELTIWVCNFLAKGFWHKSCS
jgi:hypothetical protein